MRAALQQNKIGNVALLCIPYVRTTTRTTSPAYPSIEVNEYGNHLHYEISSAVSVLHVSRQRDALEIDVIQ